MGTRFSSALGVLLLGLGLTTSAARAASPPPQPDQAAAASVAEEDARSGRALQDVLRSHGDEVHGCYAQALAQTPTLQGELLLRWWVAAGGRIERVEVLQDQTGGTTSLGRCLTTAMRRWQVPALGGDTDTRQVVFPLAFRPDTAPPAVAQETVQAAVVRRHDVRPVVRENSGQAALEARVLISPTIPTQDRARASLTWLGLAKSATLGQPTAPPAIELLYVLQGTAQVRGASKASSGIAASGDLVVVPAGVPRQLTAQTPLELLQIFVPGGAERTYLRPPTAAATNATAVTAVVPAAGGLRILRGDTIPVYVQAGEQGSAQLFLDHTDIRDIAVERLRLQAGVRLPVHRHERSDELIYLLSGRVEMRLGGIAHGAQAGDAVFLPAGLEHAITAVEPIEALQCYVPSGPEQRFKAGQAQASPSRPSTPPPTVPPSRPKASQAR